MADTVEGADMAKRTCSIDGCERSRHARGWCMTHYRRWLTHGTVDLPETVRGDGMQPKDYQRFLTHVGPADARGCRPWRSHRSRGGYGAFKAGGRMHPAHRWLLGYMRGEPLGPDELACHHCDNPPCCNPDHLYVGDSTSNMRDKAVRGRAWSVVAEQNKTKTHCVNGHEFTPANTYVKPSDGGRRCRVCTAAQQRRYQARRAAT